MAATSTPGVTPSAPPSPPTKEEAEMTQSLAQDRPTIDAAIKSYISLVCAKALTATATDGASLADATDMTETNTDATSTTITEESTKALLIGLIPSSGLAAAAPSNRKPTAGMQQPVLQLARMILQTINQYTFPIHCTVANSMTDKPNLAEEKRDSLFELSIASQLWNGLVQSKQKPSRFLGRKALKHAWKNQLGDEIRAKLMKAQVSDGQPSPIPLQLQWLQEFEHLLYRKQQQEDDDDSALLWAPDGGAEELARRRQRRQQAATQRGTE